MKVIGITGGIGAGKSLILRYMEEVYGARVVEADKVGHLLMWPGKSCFERVVAEFGTNILKDDGTINRAKLASMVFQDHSQLERLNAIIHPAVKKYIARQIRSEESAGTPYFLIEAALLIEDGYLDICDEMWYVYADETVRRERLMRDRGYDSERVARVFAQQMKDEEFRRACCFILDNSRDPAYVKEQIDQRMKTYETM